MTRTSILASAAMALTLTLGVGCDKQSDEQQKANAAQAEADKKIAEANKEAVTKTTGAQVEADRKIAAAEGEFGQRRESYRHEIQTDLIDLDKKVEVLEAKTKAAKGRAKSDLEQSLAQIRARRASFAAEFAAVETATAVQWDNTKSRVDKSWRELKAMVDTAR